jgi:zinc and cadmium transporter
MGPWSLTLISVVVVTLISLLGAAALVLRGGSLQRALVFLVPFAAGALLGDAFFHIIPELTERDDGFTFTSSATLVLGLILFFALEKILHWHHAHYPEGEVIHPVAVSNLIGDGLHNFVDGSLIAASFLVSPALGIATTLAVILHEIPQELGDFAILVHSGIAPRRALLLNLLSGSTAIIGAIVGLMAGRSVAGDLLLPITAGSFIYIASTDLLPELHKEPEPRKSMLQIVALIFGVGVMISLLPLE